MPCLNSWLCGPSVLLKFLCLCKLRTTIRCRRGNGPFFFFFFFLVFPLQMWPPAVCFFDQNTGPRIGWDKTGTQGANFREALIRRIMGEHGWQLHDPESECLLNFFAFGVSFASPYCCDLLSYQDSREWVWLGVLSNNSDISFLRFKCLAGQWWSPPKSVFPQGLMSKGHLLLPGDSSLFLGCSNASADRTWSILHLAKTLSTEEVSRGTLPEIHNFKKDMFMAFLSPHKYVHICLCHQRCF